MGSPTTAPIAAEQGRRVGGLRTGGKGGSQGSGRRWWEGKSSDAAGGGCRAPVRAAGREQPATREKTTTEGWEAEREDKIGSDTKLEWETLTLTRVETGIYIDRC